ncbi:DUF7560 family zinc ribbon protein [Natronorubrum daqingense]|uniref:Putative regulatory protein, FmdB family n=1 Tax=Natronorubrum daqingense TaxID=588898 RepID=A0A1N6ZXG2_9EURY|nr:FmdB family zinc ribbon protein [Natronorubrum daqingense]APX95214.1 transcriptional regulator [Natronorubrum daqingense]SIR31505.1 putative regulatory protein, FmdB family [Natronorubrum daqingense]
MSRFEFTCPDCTQVIEVNDSMREATLTHGCPVCGADVTQEAFDATRSQSPSRD